MGTICEVTAVDPDAAFAEAQRIESMISTWRDDSELSRVNRGEITTPSPELYAMLRQAMAISAETDGAFDPLIRPLLDAWHTRDRVGPAALGSAAHPEADAPTREQLTNAVKRSNPANATLANGTIALANGALFEEGGFGKGYALDRMLAATAGDAIINFGGQIAVRGVYKVAIAHPLHRDRPLLTLTLRDASLSTSSCSEKSSHIIDPASGEALPARGSVSIIDPSAFRADALSTALYVMGPQRGLAWARAHDVTAIFISERGGITWSKKP
jgi:thiamine biosynthesis lipoprotein